MTGEHKDEEVIFKAAMKLESAAERAGFLKSACKGDAELLARVEALLKVHYEDKSFLQPPSGTDVTFDDSPLTEGPGTIIGRYKLLQQIGEGGFGVVYMAEQEQPIRRRVALKIIKLGMDTKQVIARFEAERQALAMMDHPNIAKVLDAGATETGRPYFVMELVKGISITEYCDKNNLDTRQRLELFIDVCKAVQHAHQKGIIHRDIKPTNVMVTLRDGIPVPKVIDFGIAKATQQRLTEKTLFTEFKQFIGTPEYMSPEQAEMSELDVDTRTDIYSLGVLLYELLTGTTPFGDKELRSAGFDEIRRIIREDEPPRPSTCLSTLGDSLDDVAKHRKSVPSQLCKIIRGELDWIVMMTLEKDRTRRYETANGLARDIERHLDDEPVVAGPPSTVYRMKKFVRRNRTAVAVALAILVTLIIGLSLATVGFVKASREQARTQEALEREQQAVQNARKARDQEAIARKAAQRRKEEAVRQRDAANYNLYVAQMRLGQQYWEAGQIITLKELLEGHLPKPGRPDLRGWEWYYLLSLCHKDLLTLPGQSAGQSAIAWSPDGQSLATASREQTLNIWDMATGQKLFAIGEQAGALFPPIAWSPNGQRLASASEDRSIVKVWDATTGRELMTLCGHTERLTSIAWSPDSQRLASASYDKTAKVWDAATGEELVTLRGHTSVVYSAAWSPDGKQLASGGIHGMLKIWEVRTGQEVLSWSAQNYDLYSVAWSPDGKQLASGGYGHPVKVWEATTGREILSIPHTAGVESVAWSPDGKKIASASRNQKIQVWDSDTGQEVLALRGHIGWVRSVAWSPDGKLLASAGNDHTVKVWDARREQRALTLDHAKAISVAWSPKENLLASAGGGKIKIWDLSTEHGVLSWPVHKENDQAVAWSPDGNRLVSGRLDHQDRTVKVWDAGTGKELLTAPIGSRPHWSPDGQSLVIAAGDTVIVWDIPTGQTVFSLRGHTDRVWDACWSPDGRQIASAAWDGLVKVWDTATGENLLTLRGHTPNKYIAWVAWSPDSKRLASGGWDQTVKVWDVDMSSEVYSLRGHTGRIGSVAWSPDGSRLASTSSDETAKLWDTTTGRELLTLRRHPALFESVAWNCDGKRLATANTDGTVRVWDASIGYEISANSTYGQELGTLTDGKE